MNSRKYMDHGMGTTVGKEIVKDSKPQVVPVLEPRVAPEISQMDADGMNNRMSDGMHSRRHFDHDMSAIVGIEIEKDSKPRVVPVPAPRVAPEVFQMDADDAADEMINGTSNGMYGRIDLSGLETLARGHQQGRAHDVQPLANDSGKDPSDKFPGLSRGLE